MEYGKGITLVNALRSSYGLSPLLEADSSECIDSYSTMHNCSSWADPIPFDIWLALSFAIERKS